MTVAICFACGAFKVGAFTPCPACGAEPVSLDKQAQSLALTDHYLTPEGLAQVQQQAAAGQPVDIDADFYEQLLHDASSRIKRTRKAVGRATHPGPVGQRAR